MSMQMKRKMLALSMAIGFIGIFSNQAISQETKSRFDATPKGAVANKENLETPKITKEDDRAVPTERLGVVFGIVIVLLYLTYFGLKKYTTWNKKGVNKKRSLGVLDTIPLGNKRFVSITKIYDRVLALGVSENGISVLADLTEEEAEETAAGEGKSVQSKPGKEFFMNLIEQITPSAKKKAAVHVKAETAESALL